MAQNFKNHSYGSQPNQPSQGFEDLMGSLKSPGLTGPAVPMQPGFPTSQWPMQWQQSAAQENFPFSMPHNMSPPNQMAWVHNNKDGYVQFDQDEADGPFTVDDTGVVGQHGLQHPDSNGAVAGQMAQHPHSQQQQQQFPPVQLPSLSASSPLSLPPPQLGEGGALGPTPISKSPQVSTAATTARAAELRAKLLASRGSKSRQGSPAVKTMELTDAKKTQLLGILKQQTNGASESQSKQKPVSVGEQANKIPDLQAPDNLTTTATSLDNLMAEARNAADANKAVSPLTNGSHREGANDVKPTGPTINGIQQIDLTSHKQFPELNRSRSVSELSEPGEIRSDASTPMSTERPQPSNVTEPSRVIQDGRDEQEKLVRQNEVNRAYQPLKNSEVQASEPKTSEVKATPPAKSGKVPEQSQKSGSGWNQSAHEQTSMHEALGRDQQRGSARDSDRRDSNKGSRQPSVSQAYSTPHNLDREVAAKRQKMTEDNAKRAAEYKKNLEAQKAQGRQTAPNSKRPAQEPMIQEANTKIIPQNLSRVSSRKASATSKAPEKNEAQIDQSINSAQDIDTVMVSPQAEYIEVNGDVSDWLELTEFYDEEYREKRLRLFRKKKALDIQRAELEREEELELQERTRRTRPQSILATGIPPSTARRHTTANVRMPPPPLPLPFREADQDAGMRIKDSALSAGLPASQKSSPKLKRQYAEDDTEKRRTNSVDKRVRLDMSGPSSDDRPLTSPSSVRGDRSYAPSEAPALESRISRYDSWAPRPRSRSPEYRRRSLSPRGRRDYSPLPPGGYRAYDDSNGPRKNDERTCFNCGERGHMLNHCPAPRRDSKDLQPTTSRGYEQWVSPNYRGKNPIAKPPPNRSPHPRPGANNRARMKSTGEAPTNARPGSQSR